MVLTEQFENRAHLWNTQTVYLVKSPAQRQDFVAYVEGEKVTFNDVVTAGRWEDYAAKHKGAEKLVETTRSAVIPEHLYEGPNRGPGPAATPQSSLT